MVNRHVVTRPNPPMNVCAGRLTLHQVPSARDNLIWLLVCNETGDAAVVDGPEAGSVLAYCERHQIKLTKVLNTHTHPDHIGLNLDLEKRGLLAELDVYGCPTERTSIPGLSHQVDEGSTVAVGLVEGQVWRTEGHLDGHVSYIFDGLVFCGDTLFTGGCGYLFDGPAAKMYDSLRRLRELPDDTLVCCAHEYTQDNLAFARTVEPENPELLKRIADTNRMRGEGRSVVPSPMGLEKRTNPFLRWDSIELQSNLGTVPRAAANYVEVFRQTRSLKDQKYYKK